MKIFILILLSILTVNTNIYGNSPTLRTIDNSFTAKNLEGNFITINGTKLYPIREVFNNFGYNVSWNKNSPVIVVSNKSSKYYITQYTVYKNRVYLSLADINKHMEKPIYVSQDLNILYSNKNLTTKTLISLIPSYNNYSKEDLNWLSKIVSAESRGEKFSAQVDVANVIINRVSSQQYPNNIYDVIFDNKNGVQFTPTINGHIYKEPTLSSYLAALEVLENTTFATTKNQDALFFINPVTAKSSWVHNNRGFAFANGNHNFYY